MEANPTTFYKGVTSHWRRRKYQKLDDASAAPHGGKKRHGAKVAKLGPGGGGRGGGRRFWRIRPKFRLRFKIPSLTRILGRIRDAYVDWMLGLAGKSSGLAFTGPTAVWSNTLPLSRKDQAKRDDKEIKMLFEIYRSLVASGEIKASQV